jgi:hypothetical protein
MDANSLRNGNHSAEVHMHLRLDGHILPIAQLGRDFLILTTPIDHPPADAEIDMSIDGVKRRWLVRLTDGLAVGTRESRIAPCSSRCEAPGV